MTITHEGSPNKKHTREFADLLAESLRLRLPNHKVRIEENLMSRFDVVIELPFRVDHSNWQERQAHAEEAIPVPETKG